MKTNNSSNMQKTTKDIAAVTLATAAGAAAGTASSAAVIQHIDTVNADQVDDVTLTDEVEVEDTDKAQSAARTEIIHEPAARPSATIAPDAELIDTAEIEVASEDDVAIHVIGVEAVDNNMGGMAIVATLESEGETALMADIDADGLMDFVVYDADGNGVITEDEIQDIQQAGIMTEDVIDAYQMESLAQNVGMDGPDYMNDADTAYFDA